MTEVIMESIFGSLLGINTDSDTNVNDNTIEAAIKLVSKLGLTFEKKIKDQRNAEKAKKLQDSFDLTFARLKDL